MRWLIIGGVIALLAGCSALRLTYNQGPTIAYWWIDRYVDLEPPQSTRVRAALDDWFRWHRSTQLEDLSQLLGKARTQVTQNATPAQICRWTDDLTDRLMSAYERAVPAIAEIVPTLGAEQLETLERRYASNNRDFAKDYQQDTPEARQKAAVKRDVKRAEDFYGRLGSAQNAVIVRQVAASPFDAELALAERRARQQEILASLRRYRTGTVPQETIRAELLQIAQRIRRSPREPYRALQQRLHDQNCAFIAELHNATTTEQRAVAVTKIDGWQADIRSLIATTPP